MDRRKFLKSGAAAAALSVVNLSCAAKEEKYQQGISRWPICLNTGTIRPAPLQDKIKIAAETGYDGVELWIDDLEKHEKEGGSLKELGAQIKEQGLFVPNIIGLWGCMPMDDDDFKTSLEATKRRMRMSADVGSGHVAAIPVPDRADFDLNIGVKRYKELLKIAREEYGIIAAFEFVGFFKGIHRLGQAAAIALDADDRDACLIMDTFHLYRGASGFNGISLLNKDIIADFHWNDVPADPPREALSDKDRIYPGDGILPLVGVLNDLKEIGYRGPISLEMFNREHWVSDLKEVAATGREKILALMEKAGKTRETPGKSARQG